MKLIVNGAEHEHTGAGQIAEVIAEAGADAVRTAVMVNDNVVPRAEWDVVTLGEGDRVELLVFAGGG